MDSVTLPKVSFFLREKKSRRKNYGALYMRIYYDGINSEISLKKEIPLTHWNKKTGELKGNSQFVKELKLFSETSSC